MQQFIVLCEFLPGVTQIWVARLTPEDPIYTYPTLEEAEAKAAELQAADETGRLYKAEEYDETVTY
jgi:hypothetical protein